MFGGVGGDTDTCQVRTTLRGRTRVRVRTRPTSLSQNQTAASSQNPAMFHFGGPEALEWNIDGTFLFPLVRCMIGTWLGFEVGVVGLIVRGQVDATV